VGAEGIRAVERDYDAHTLMKAYDELLRLTLGGTR
jgi:hypothetical protein